MAMKAVVGAEALSEEDNLYLKFTEKFEDKFLRQGKRWWFSCEVIRVTGCRTLRKPHNFGEPGSSVGFAADIPKRATQEDSEGNVG